MPLQGWGFWIADKHNGLFLHERGQTQEMPSGPDYSEVAQIKT